MVNKRGYKVFPHTEYHTRLSITQPDKAPTAQVLHET